MVNKFTDRFSKQHVLLTGLLLYSIGYVTITSANSWYLLLLFNFIGVLLMIGTLLVYTGLFIRKPKKEQVPEPKIV
ncbi:hypothetical protein QL992_14650 [Microbacterium sp. APC 3898]|nr:hypothetical protein [Microbacterium sp. APC 3898]MDN3500457.1 hypothetical protein [Microbacterium sp. APC 3898]